MAQPKKLGDAIYRCATRGAKRDFAAMRKAYRVLHADNEIRVAHAIRNPAATQQPSAAARHGIDRLISSRKACRVSVRSRFRWL
jgi:hypothetical protein